MLHVGFHLGKTLSEIGRMSLLELRLDMRLAILNSNVANLLSATLRSDLVWELNDFRYFRDEGEETPAKVYSEDQWWEMMIGYKRGPESCEGHS